MKRFFIYILAFLVSGISYGQDPTVNGADITPNPGVVNGAATFTFNFQNISTAPIDIASDSTRIIISFNKIIPVLDGSGNLQISGPGSIYFTWTYDALNKIIKGTQNQQIPGATVATPVGGSISFNAIFSEAATQADAAGGNGNGANINIVPGTGGNLNSGNDNTSDYAYTTGALPVAFGFIQGTFSGSKMKVAWATLSEINNKYFIIEASKDGSTFQTIDTISSKAQSGNSGAEIKYVFEKNWEQVVSLLGFSAIPSVFIIIILLLIISRKRNRKALLIVPMVCVVSGIAIFSCRKNDRTIENPNTPVLYIRIGQVDIDGTKGYSKIVKVINE